IVLSDPRSGVPWHSSRPALKIKGRKGKCLLNDFGLALFPKGLNFDARVATRPFDPKLFRSNSRASCARNMQVNKERDQMEKQSRRSLLKGAVKAAAVVTAGSITAEKLSAQATGKLEKRSPLPATPEPAAPQTGAKPLF